MVLLEYQTEGVRERALALFAGKAQRAIGLRGEVVIFITTNRQVQEMNRLYRKKNEPTDVLSFPSQSPKLIGDIAISGEIAVDNAAELGHPAETELQILILHGLLHLAGYDHENDKGEMRAYEARLQKRFGLPTGLIERTHALTPSAQGPSTARKHAARAKKSGDGSASRMTKRRASPRGSGGKSA